MSPDDEEEGHDHHHGPGCGHPEIRHGDHADYLHNGHLHAVGGPHDAGHKIEVSRRWPRGCAPIECGETHSATCGHPAVPHGEHVDYAVNGALHHPHGDHCDLHGPV